MLAHSSFARRFACFAGCLLALASPGPQARAAEPLTAHVAAEAAFCLEIPQPFEQGRKLWSSPLAERFRQTEVFRNWRESRPFQKMQQTASAIETLAARPLDEVFQELLGDESLVVGYLIPQQKEPEFVLLTRPMSVEAVERFFETWDKAQPHETTAVEHSGGKYFVRIPVDISRPNPPQPLYYIKQAGLFAVSKNEEMIQRTLQVSPEQSLAQAARYRRAHNALPADRLVTLYLNTRAFDDRIGTDAKSPEDAAFQRRIWRSLDSIAFDVRYHQGLLLDASVQLDAQQVGPVWSEIAGNAVGALQFPERIPADSFSFFTGRVDLGTLFRFFRGFMKEKDKQGLQKAAPIARGLLLGYDLFDDVLPRLGPQVGINLTTPPDLSDRQIPVDAMIAWELQPEPRTEAKQDSAAQRPPIHIALQNALMTVWNIAAGDYNSKHPKQPVASLRTRVVGENTIYWIEKIESYRPAFTVNDKFLAFATSPEPLEDFVSPKTPRLTEAENFGQWRRHFFAETNQAGYCNIEMLRDYLQQHREALVKLVSKGDEKPQEEVAKRLARFEDILRCGDGVVLAGRLSEPQLQLTIGLMLADE